MKCAECENQRMVGWPLCGTHVDIWMKTKPFESLEDLLRRLKE